MKKISLKLIRIISIIIIVALSFNLVSYAELGNPNGGPDGPLPYSTGTPSENTLVGVLIGTDGAQGQNGEDHYYGDNSNYTPPPSFEVGSDIWTIPTDASNYDRASEAFDNLAAESKDGTVTVELELTECTNVNSTDVDIVHHNGNSGKQVIDGDGKQTIEATMYKDADGALHVIAKDGTEINLKGEFRLSGIKIGGQSYYRLGGFYRLFWTNGDPNDPDDPDDPDDPNDPEKPERKPAENAGTDILGWTSTQNIPYRHKEPDYRAKIYSSNGLYHCQVAIPTSENLDYEAWADDVLYDINTRKLGAGANTNGELHLLAAIIYWIQIMNEDGSTSDLPIVFSKTDTFSYGNSTSGYDVNKSDISNLSKALVTATQGSQILAAPDGAHISFNVNIGASAQPRQPWAVNNNAQKTWIEDRGYGWPTGGEEAELEGMIQMLKAGIVAKVNASFGISGSCNYTFKALHVDNNNHNFTEPGWTQDPHGFLRNQMIPENYLNGLYEGKVEVTYVVRSGAGCGGVWSSKEKCNDVIVHTPVVCYATITAKDFVNQSVNIKNDRTYLQLDGNFTVKIPNDGDYTGWPNYGHRDYNSMQAVPGKNTNWGKIEDIKLPFDVYIFDDNYNTNGKKYFLKHDTWLSESGITGVDFKGSAAGITWRFTVPVWAKEGEYLGNKGIKLRVIAENAPSKDAGLEQELANTQADHSKYIAIKYIPVEVIGKIYDLQVNESTDKDWIGNVQSLGYSTGYVRANEFPFGRTRSTGVTPAVNPSQNKNTAYPYAPKLGYTFVFNFKTKGRKSNQIDVKVAENGFYFVAKTGGTAIPVDLYYMASNGNYLKITPENNVSKIGVTLTNKFMGVEPIEMNNSNTIYPLENLPKYNYQLRVECGTLAKLLLPHNLRLTYDNFNEYMTDNGGRKLYGNTKAVIAQNAKTAVAHYGFNSAETGEQMVIGSVGHWYAGYALPSSTVAVKQGTDPVTADKAIKTNDSTLTYKTGYILVRFKIKSLNTKAPIVPATPGTTITPGDDYLQYKGPETLNDATGIEYTADEKDKTPGKDFNNPDVVWTIATGMRDITLPSGSPAKVPNDAVAIYETDWNNVVDNDGTMTN